MALFKTFRGNRASLDRQPLHDGYAYFCIDDGTFHIDCLNSDGVLQRKEINAKYAEDISKIEEELNSLITKPTEGLSYELSNDGTYYICTGIGTAATTDIVIANEVNNKPVMGIATSAFEGCSCTSVHCPNNLEYINDGAFEGSFDLKSITFGKNLKSIGATAFFLCTNLENIFLPKSVVSVGNSAFGACYKLTICCEAESKPESWHADWNSGPEGIIPVVWGYCSDFISVNEVLSTKANKDEVVSTLKTIDDQNREKYADDPETLANYNNLVSGYHRIYAERPNKGIYPKYTLTDYGMDVYNDDGSLKWKLPRHENVAENGDYPLGSIPLRQGKFIDDMRFAGHIFTNTELTKDGWGDKARYADMIVTPKKYVDNLVDAKVDRLTNQDDKDVVYTEKAQNTGLKGIPINYISKSSNCSVYDFNDDSYTEDSSAVLNQIFFASGIEVISAGTANNSSQLASVKSDTNRGKYLNIYSEIRAPELEGTKERSHIIKLPSAQIINDNPNVAVLEFDMRPAGSHWYECLLNFVGASSFKLGTHIENLALNVTRNWFTLRLEAYLDQNVVQVYVDNNYRGTLTSNTGGEFTADNFGDGSNVRIDTYNANGSVDFSIDNISFYKTFKEYKASPDNITGNLEIPLRRIADGTMQCETPENAAGNVAANVDYVNSRITASEDNSVLRMNIIDQNRIDNGNPADETALETFKNTWSRLYVERSKGRGLYGKIALSPTGDIDKMPMDYDEGDTNVILGSVPQRIGDDLGLVEGEAHSRLAGHILVSEDLEVEAPNKTVGYYYPKVATPKKYVDTRIDESKKWAKNKVDEAVQTLVPRAPMSSESYYQYNTIYESRYNKDTGTTYPALRYLAEDYTKDPIKTYNQAHVPLRNYDGRFYVRETPTENIEATSKKYVDKTISDNVSTKADRLINNSNKKVAYVIGKNNESIEGKPICEDLSIYAPKGRLIYSFENDLYTEDTTSAVLNQLTFESGIRVTGNGTGNASNQLASVKSDDVHGKYLNIYSDKRAAETNGKKERSHSVTLPAPQILKANPNVAVLEFDMCANGSNWYEAELRFVGEWSDTTKKYETLRLGWKLENQIQLSNKGEWVTVRLEAYLNEHVLQVYVNNKYKGTITSNSKGAFDDNDFNDINLVAFNTYNGSGSVDLSLDNISFYKTVKPFEECPPSDDDETEIVIRRTSDGTMRCSTPDNSAEDVVANVGYVKNIVESIATNSTTGNIDDTAINEKLYTIFSNTSGTPGLSYELSSDGSYYICTGLGTATDSDIVIASYIDGIPVTMIGDGAFLYYNDPERRSITSCVIPNTITCICSHAFSYQHYLSSLFIPKSVIEVGRSINYLESTGSIIMNCEASELPSGWDHDWNLLADEYMGGVPLIVYAQVNWNVPNPNKVTEGKLKEAYLESIDSSISPIEERLNKIDNIAKADVQYTQGLAYQLSNDGTYYIVNSCLPDLGFKNGDIIKIPPVHNGKPVKEISRITGDEGCHEVDIYIPNSVISIKGQAFIDISGNIYIPNSVTSILGFLQYIGIISSYSAAAYYCEAASKPDGWDVDWNHVDELGEGWSHYTPVYWNAYTPEGSQDPVYDNLQAISDKLNELEKNLGTGTGTGTGSGSNADITALETRVNNLEQSTNKKIQDITNQLGDIATVLAAINTQIGTFGGV